MYLFPSKQSIVGLIILDCFGVLLACFFIMAGFTVNQVATGILEATIFPGILGALFIVFVFVLWFISKRIRLEAKLFSILLLICLGFHVVSIHSITSFALYVEISRDIDFTDKTPFIFGYIGIYIIENALAIAALYLINIAKAAHIRFIDNYQVKNKTR
jgi:hypothetical protein